MVVVGKKYKTVGGWEALVIHINTMSNIFWAIHAPGTANESSPISHQMNGMSMPLWSIGEPPRYGKTVPSDILTTQEITQ